MKYLRDAGQFTECGTITQNVWRVATLGGRGLVAFGISCLYVAHNGDDSISVGTAMLVANLDLCLVLSQHMLSIYKHKYKINISKLALIENNLWVFFKQTKIWE